MARLINDSLLAELDVEAAIREEVAETADLYSLLPRAPLDDAAADDEVLDAICANLLAAMSSDELLDSPAAPVVSASKWRYGRRPAMGLTLSQRTLYRALVSEINEGLASPRSESDHSTFLRDPLESDSKYQFVISTDIAHYYATMNLDLLSQELVDRTGRWGAVRALEGLLRTFSPQRGGLPQGTRTSDRLADTYMETLGHRLIRAGIECFWYADDFRIVTRDYSGAVHALDVLDRECQQMGLFINERKTWILRRTRYKEIVDRPVAAITGAWRAKLGELSMIDPYSMMSIQPDDVEVLAGVAQDEFDAWSELAEDFLEQPGTNAPKSLDLATAIRLLMAAGESAGLKHIPKLLRVEPQHTPVACRYLRKMLQENRDEAWHAAKEALRVDSLTDWQRLWLLDAFMLPISEESPWDPQAEIREWSESMQTQPNEILRTHAIWATGLQGHLTRGQWEMAVRDASSYGEKTLAAASALASDLPSKAHYTDMLSVKLHTWAKEQYVEDQ